MLIGYARVSTEDQNLDLQRRALAAAGCAQTFEDQVSGAVVDRPGLTQALKIVQAGDVLVVWKLDRLARSLKQLIATADDLKGRGIGLVSLTDAIDTSSPGGMPSSPRHRASSRLK